MPVSRNVFQSKWALALSAFALGAFAGPAVGPALRPALRKAVKAGILAQRRLTTVVAGLREELEDIVAEAKDELGEEPSPSGHHHHGDSGHSPKGAA